MSAGSPQEEALTAEHLAVIELIKFYLKEIEKPGEHLWLDPDPGHYKDQIHIHINDGSKFKDTPWQINEMVCWFNRQGSVLEVTQIRWDPSIEEYGLRSARGEKISLADPKATRLKQILRQQIRNALNRLNKRKTEKL